MIRSKFQEINHWEILCFPAIEYNPNYRYYYDADQNLIRVYIINEERFNMPPPKCLIEDGNVHVICIGYIDNCLSHELKKIMGDDILVTQLLITDRYDSTTDKFLQHRYVEQLIAEIRKIAPPKSGNKTTTIHLESITHPDKTHLTLSAIYHLITKLKQYSYTTITSVFSTNLNRIVFCNI